MIFKSHKSERDTLHIPYSVLIKLHKTFQAPQAHSGSSSATGARRSSKVSQHSVSMDEQSLRRMSIHEGNYDDERNANSYNTVSSSSRSNSVSQPQEQSTAVYSSHQHDQQLQPRNAYARSNVRMTQYVLSHHFTTNTLLIRVL